MSIRSTQANFKCTFLLDGADAPEESQAKHLANSVVNEIMLQRNVTGEYILGLLENSCTQHQFPAFPVEKSELKNDKRILWLINKWCHGRLLAIAVGYSS